MDAVNEKGKELYINGGYDYLSELQSWFLVSGDTDDFIFYGEPEINHSEK